MFRDHGVTSPFTNPTNPGPCPPGDPGAMRALAGKLRSHAGELGRRDNLDLSAWRSDRAEVVKSQLSSHAAVLSRSSTSLSGLAGELDREADVVEQARLDWSVRYSAWINRDSSIPASKI